MYRLPLGRQDVLVSIKTVILLLVDNISLEWRLNGIQPIDVSLSGRVWKNACIEYLTFAVGHNWCCPCLVVLSDIRVGFGILVLRMVCVFRGALDKDPIKGGVSHDLTGGSEFEIAGDTLGLYHPSQLEDREVWLFKALWCLILIKSSCSFLWNIFSGVSANIHLRESVFHGKCMKS